MKADITRDTFDAVKQFTRVLSQQGRVTVDADLNEQTEILLHYLRALARDLIGPYGAPAEDAGFRLRIQSGALLIGAGRYYVDGILVENGNVCPYDQQPYFPLPDGDPLKDLTQLRDQLFWLYLDVWERHITSLDDDLIRETALGGPDTTSRTTVVWQVKALRIERDQFQSYAYSRPYGVPGSIRSFEPYSGYYGQELDCHAPLHQLTSLSYVQMAARVDPGHKIHDACVTPPDSKYRGVENHLYRVEIHHGGNASEATFKWSRENGSVVTNCQGIAGNDLQVANVRGFSAGNWIELSDDTFEYQGVEGLLVKVAKVQDGNLTIDPASVPSSGLPPYANLKNAKVRRWDQSEKGNIKLLNGAVPVVETPVLEPADDANWINLEDGIQVAFSQLEMSSDGIYRTGDYWLIPARVLSGNIEWPEAKHGKMSLQRPRGVIHHYAPLIFIRGDENNQVHTHSCFCEFEPLSDCLALGYRVTGAHLLKDSKQVIAAEMSESAQARDLVAARTGKEAKPARKRPGKRAPAKRGQ